MKLRSAHKIMGRKLYAEIHVETDLREIGCNHVNWTQLAHDMGHSMNYYYYFIYLCDI
jgi:hypothetical protein